MKPFDTLTTDELVALEYNRTELDRYVDFACAEQGIPLLPPEAPAPPAKDQVIPDLKLFTLGGLSFFDRKDAEKIREALQKTRLAKTEYIELGYRTDYNRKQAIAEYEIPTITETEAFSPSYAGKHKIAIQAYNTAKEAYDAESSAYNKICSKRVGVAKQFQDKIVSAKTVQLKTASMQAEFRRYMDLAEGNLTIASRFMISAYPDAHAYVPELQSYAVVNSMQQ